MTRSAYCCLVGPDLALLAHFGIWLGCFWRIFGCWQFKFRFGELMDKFGDFDWWWIRAGWILLFGGFWCDFFGYAFFAMFIGTVLLVVWRFGTWFWLFGFWRFDLWCFNWRLSEQAARRLLDTPREANSRQDLTHPVESLGGPDHPSIQNWRWRGSWWWKIWRLKVQHWRIEEWRMKNEEWRMKNEDWRLKIEDWKLKIEEWRCLHSMDLADPGFDFENKKQETKKEEGKTRTFYFFGGENVV